MTASPTSTLESYREAWARQDAQQDLVNRAAVSSPVMAERFARRFAIIEHAPFAQYAGHWDGWKFAQVHGDVRTKGGLRFADGDWVLYKVSLSSIDFCRVTAYSVRGAIDCSLPSGALRWWEHQEGSS